MRSGDGGKRVKKFGGLLRGDDWRLSHRFDAQPREPVLFWLAEHAKAATGCPTACQQRTHVQPLPERGAHDGPETRKAAAPVAEVRQVTQQHVTEQRRPELPAHRVGTVAEKVAQPELCRYRGLLR